MLVLSRKEKESIIIGDNITIVVLEVRGDKVRLGIEAPKAVPVHRKEVYDAIKRDEAKGQTVRKRSEAEEANGFIAMIEIDLIDIDRRSKPGDHSNAERPESRG